MSAVIGITHDFNKNFRNDLNISKESKFREVFAVIQRFGF